MSFYLFMLDQKQNKLFSLNFAMVNPNPSLFLSNVQQNPAQKMKNSDFYGFFHNSAITVSLSEILQILLYMYLTYGIKCFPSILVMPIQANPSLFLGNVYWKLANKMKTVTAIVFYIMKLSLSSCLKFQKHESVSHIE